MTSLREEFSGGKIHKNWANFVAVQMNPFKKGNIYHSCLTSFWLLSTMCFLKNNHEEICTLTIHDCYATYKDVPRWLSEDYTGAACICCSDAQSSLLAKPIEDLDSDCGIIYARYIDRMSVNSVYKIGLGKFFFSSIHSLQFWIWTWSFQKFHVQTAMT